MDDVLVRTKEFFEREPDARLVLIFGSYASGRIHSASDIDVAVAYPLPLSVEERVGKAQALSAVVNREVDLIDLHDARGVLLQQILANRKTLINRDPELYGNVISRRVNEESDLMPLYERMLQARRERFLSGKKGH
jgi:predicted nucleotidyltransferase